MSQKLKWGVLILTCMLVILADQVSKQWVLDTMELGQTIIPIPALHPYFQFTRSFNTGAAFGIFPDGGDTFLVIAIVISAIILVFYYQAPADARLQQVSLALVLGGATGNVIDRYQHGHVIDFIHYRIPDLISNVSNLADHAIVIGVGLLLLDNILRERRQNREQAQDVADAPPEA